MGGAATFRLASSTSRPVGVECFGVPPLRPCWAPDSFVLTSVASASGTASLLNLAPSCFMLTAAATASLQLAGFSAPSKAATVCGLTSTKVDAVVVE